MSRRAAWLFALIGLAVLAAVAGGAGNWQIFVIGALALGLFLSWRRVTHLERALEDERVERIRGYWDLRHRIEPPAREPVAEPVPEPVVEAPPSIVEPEVAPVAPLPPITPAFTEPPRLRESWAKTVRSALDLEQMLGANWLSKIGVAILVLGIAFFLAWQLRELGPAGKIVVGVVVSAALLGAGVWGERFERYRILARASLAGGWPLLFFVAYASHHIAAARVIRSPLAGFVFMLAVVAAMVAHTLRFRSQVVTGLAFSIAFATVALNRVDVYSLTANVALAIGLAFVVVRMRWYVLEIIGIAATYLNHYIWLVPIIAPMHGKLHPFPQFYTSAAILLLYWAVFRASYVIRSPFDEKTSAVAGILNSALLLGVMKYQSAHPELAFAALLTLGAIELALARLPMVRRKRTSFLVLTTIGVVLVVAAIPFRYAAGWVSPLWLLEAALLLVVGIITNERAYRRLGTIAALATAVQLLSVPGARLIGFRLGGAQASPEWMAGTIFVASMLAFYAASEFLPRRWPAMFGEGVDRRLGRYLSYAAAVIGLIGGWALFPGSGAAVFWIALALILAMAGRRLAAVDLTIQASLIAVAAALRVLIVNLPSNSVAAGNVSWRLVTVSVVVAGIYALSRWIGNEALPLSRFSPAAVTWIGSGLLALLAWYELLPISVAIAWTITGIVLLELALRRASVPLRYQAYLLLAAAYVRVFVVNMNAGNIPRIYTIVPIVVGFFFVYQRLSADAPAASKISAWLAVIAVVALLRFELAGDAVAIAWAALALLLVAFAAMGVGAGSQPAQSVAVPDGPAESRPLHRVFLDIGAGVALAAFARAVLHNLYERSYFPPPASTPRWLVVAIASALLFATLPFAFRMRRLDAAEEPVLWKRPFRWVDARPEQILFYIPLLLVTILLGTEMRYGMLTVAWGLEAVAVFLFALWVGERSYRLSGLALLLLCVGKIFVFDFWSLTLRDKALTGIIVGVALIAVSVLYTRKREAILQFL